MKTKLTYILLLLLLSGNTYAGWYECYNFTGKIDKYPITLSFQIREGYFGEKDKKQFNVIGVYKYDKYNNPIRLEGIYTKKTGDLTLYELYDEKIAATFHLNLKSDSMKGYWENATKNLEVNLLFKDQLSDLSNEEFDNRDILQYNSLKDFYFVGIYKKDTDNTYRTTMTDLKIIRKKDNTLYQTLNFDTFETGTGNLMTIIYDNVSTGFNDHQFTVSNDAGRIGGFFVVTYNEKNGKFILDPEPVIEGVFPDE